MGIKNIVRLAATICVVYGASKVSQLVGIGRGFVMGCRYAGDDSESAAKLVAEWDETKEAWERLKSRRKKA